MRGPRLSDRWFPVDDAVVDTSRLSPHHRCYITRGANDL
jgi:hypothetical protein